MNARSLTRRDAARSLGSMPRTNVSPTSLALPPLVLALPPPPLEPTGRGMEPTGTPATTSALAANVSTNEPACLAFAADAFPIAALALTPARIAAPRNSDSAM